jgi:cell division protein FtsB
VRDEISIGDIVITWFLFWVLTLAGLVLFAGVILVPLWQEQVKLAMEYQAVNKQVATLRREVDQVNDQLTALWVDPEYTEHIARSNLNLRKVGEETIFVEPLPVIAEAPQPVDPAETSTLYTVPPDFSKSWWYKPFLDPQKRVWFLYLSGGLVATGLITAIAGKDRRLRALGF